MSSLTPPKLPPHGARTARLSPALCLPKAAATLALLLGASAASPTHAFPPEPRIFGIPPRVPAAEIGDHGGRDDDSQWFVELYPEYRTRLIHISPLDLSGTHATNVAWGEQRFRLDASMGYRGIGAIHVQIDALDGVIFGDNGEFGRSPEPTSGVGIASRQANNAGWRIGLLPGGDPLSVDGYGPVLTGMDPININYIYGEVLLPFGVFRVGRQPVADGGTVSLNDGRSGRNLWGVSSYHESADRLLFGTKISELFNVIAGGPDYQIDTSLDNGVFLGLVWDYLVEDQVTDPGDDLQGFSAQLDFRWKRPSFGEAWGHLRFTATGTYRWDDRFNTSIFAVPLRLSFSVGDLSFLGEFAYISGNSSELSEGFAALKRSPITNQDIQLTTARAILNYQLCDFTFRLEWGYADGDDDPRTTTPLYMSSWPRDTNLGLLLFKHTLAFQSARSAAIGIENLRQLNAPSFPITEVATDGRVSNVNAIFPQIFYEPVPEVRLKAGVLFAWTAAPVVDPIQTLLAWDGDEISDDAVNYNGGKPGRYWGTEIDLGVEWRFKKMFELGVEAAVLLPGSALKDDNGDAVPSWLVETRFTFRP